MIKEERFNLTKQEQESALGKKLLDHLEHRLDVMRKQNDGDKSAEETAKLRGRIAMVKELRGLFHDDPVDRKADGV